jgi:hypothetical protein
MVWRREEISQLIVHCKGNPIKGDSNPKLDTETKMGSKKAQKSNLSKSLQNGPVCRPRRYEPNAT